MKKLLIASTALVATAGMAAADVSLSGWAEMGVHSSDRLGDYFTDGNTQMFSGVDVRFTMTGETDNGLTFGASIDLDEAAKTTSESASNNSAVWIKGGFGNLTMGDTDGASDWALTEVAMGSSIQDDHTEHAGYSGNSDFDSGTILRYDNTFGDFGVAVSVANLGSQKSQDDLTAADAAGETVGLDGETIAVGIKYGADLGGAAVALGLGYVDGDGGSILGVSAKTSIAGFDVVLNYSDGDKAGVDYTHTAIGLGYTVGDLLLHANYGEKDNGGVKTDGYAIVANYSLGGGATVMAGYGSDDAGDTMSLGLGLSF